MWMTLAFLVYLVPAIYSMVCTPDVFFRIFKFRDTPEYAFFYFISCVFLTVTLIGAVARIAFLLHDARRAT